MKTLLVIVGPTGVGKTELSMDIAERFGIPIINADSRQIYKEIPVGTAAPTMEQQKRVKHYFVGTLRLTDYYSASMYEQDVMNLLDGELFANGDVALMSGGSMMYVDAVCKGIDDIPTIDTSTRAAIRDRYEKKGLDALCQELQSLDPEYFSIVDRNNSQRIIHALEICTMTGRTYTSFRTNKPKQRAFNIIKIGVNRDRVSLYERINRRVDDMFRQGLEREARSVYPLRGTNALNTVGYKELFEYFDNLQKPGEVRRQLAEPQYGQSPNIVTMKDAVGHIQSNTRRYCRKQLTWFMHDKSIRWFSPENKKEIIDYIYTQL
jgi:tRNA dimethylallyltransferase